MEEIGNRLHECAAKCDVVTQAIESLEEEHKGVVGSRIILEEVYEQLYNIAEELLKYPKAFGQG